MLFQRLAVIRLNHTASRQPIPNHPKTTNQPTDLSAASARFPASRCAAPPPAVDPNSSGGGIAPAPVLLPVPPDVPLSPGAISEPATSSSTSLKGEGFRV